MATSPQPLITTRSRQRRTPLRLALASATALTVLTVGACGDSGDTPAAPTSTPAPSAPGTGGSTTTAPPATSSPSPTAAVTTSSRATVTTTVPATTAPPVTTARPTSTTTAASALALRGDGIGPVTIGRDSANDVINTISAVFGPAASDQATACESGSDRTVRWDRAPIIAVFSRGTFAGYLYGRAGTSGTPALATPTGLHIGSPRSALQTAYPTGLQVFDASIGTEYLAPDGLRGTLSANTASATIETIGAGDICAFR